MHMLITTDYDGGELPWIHTTDGMATEHKITQFLRKTGEGMSKGIPLKNCQWENGI